MGATGWTRSYEGQDIGLIRDLFMSDCGFQNAPKIVLILDVFSGHCLSISDTNCQRLGLSNRCFCMECIAQINSSG